MFRKILIAVDPTHTEEGARALATSLAQLEAGGEMRLLTIIGAEGTGFFPYVPEQPLADTENSARQSLEALIEKYVPETIRCQPHVIHGVTENALYDEAANWGADLLVLTSHGGPGRWSLRRDTVQKICGHPPCAVLVVPAPEEDITIEGQESPAE